MAKDVEQLSMTELMDEVRRLRQQVPAGVEIRRTLHDLEVYREETRVQNEQLMEAHHQQEQSRDRFAELYDYAPLAYVTLDSNGVVKEINLTGAELLGVERARILDTPFLVFVMDSDQRLFLEHLRRCRAARGRYVTKLSIITRERRVIPVQLSSRQAFENSESGTSCLTAIVDLTERKRAEQAIRNSEVRLRKMNQALEQRTAQAEQMAAQLRALASELTQVEQRERRRLAQVLHDDLQQTLVAAKMRIAALRRTDNSPLVSQVAQKVEELIGSSIEVSRSLTLELSPPVLYEASLALALQWLARRMQEKHDLHVDIEVNPGAEPTSEDIRVLIFQALQELLFNIVKHAGVGSARVAVGRDNGNVRVLVEDRGKGFEPASLTKPGGKTEEFGLFNIQQRLVVFGGWLDIESAPGRGTRITLVAPIESEQAGPAIEPASIRRPAPPAVAPARHSDEKTRVLLADDHKILREGLAGLLREQPKIEVVGEASDGRVAVEMAQQLHPDVVVMDVSMPHMNGIEATRCIMSEMPDVKVIGLSMHEESDMAAAMREAGAVAYLTKGGPSEALIAAIRGCLTKADVSA